MIDEDEETSPFIEEEVCAIKELDPPLLDPQLTKNSAIRAGKTNLFFIKTLSIKLIVNESKRYATQ